MPKSLKPSTPRCIAAAAAVEVSLAAEGAPAKRIHLLPLGTVEFRDGRGPFVLNNPEAVVAATRAYHGRTHILVDYDHQSHFGVKDGVAARAEAAGWIDPATLTIEADGIWGEVEWTAAAADKLRGREYRYVSPYFLYDKNSKAVLSIQNTSLVNTPAIEILAAAASAEIGDTLETDDMLRKVAAALGLTEAATEDEVMQKLASLSAGSAAATASVAAAATQLGLAADATVEQVAAAAVAAKPDPAKFVPMAAFTELQGQVTALLGGQVDGVVAAAMAAGKVTPALKDWALDYATRDGAGFQGWLSKAPVVLEVGEVVAAAHLQAGTDGLTDTERAVAKTLGRTPEQFLEAKKEG